MGTITADKLYARAQRILQDTTSIRWPTSELLDWLDDGMLEVTLLRPEASITNSTIAMTANSTKQTLPAAALQLIKVTRNMGAAGSTPGAAIRLVSMDILDSQNPNWHTDTAAAAVKHYMFDPRDPKTFYVYPQPNSTYHLEVVYSSAPTKVTRSGAAPNETSTSAISVDDIYANALLDYMLYRAYSKDATFAQNSQLAVAHYAAFQNSLGVKTQNEMVRNPNVIGGGTNPNVPKAA